MRAWALALVFAGCGFSAAPGTPNGGRDGDDGGDPGAGGSMPPGGSGGGGSSTTVHVCLGAFLQVCADVPRGPLALPAGTLDTSTSSRCLPQGAFTTRPTVDACVIASQTISVPKDTVVSVTGQRPLILIADDAATSAGTLDAASHRGGPTGRAADRGPCPRSSSEPTTNTAAGAWGATFGGPGGSGGNTSAGIGGVPGSALQIAALGGGCPGGNGADSDQNHGGGKGGHGGGAVVLLAGNKLMIDGVVNASGGGGSGGDAVSGGGGGGGGG